VPAPLYDYAVIRAVPRVEREEFVNVGAILSCPGQRFLDACVAVDPARLRMLDPHVDLEAVQRHLDALVAVARGLQGSGPIGQLPQRARFHWLTARRSAVIQVSPVHTGWCNAAPDTILQDLMTRMVLPPASSIRADRGR